MSVSHVTLRKVESWDEAEASFPPVWFLLGGGTVAITCGGCGIVSNISGWTISDDGTVSPSFFHNDEKCGWHVWGQLLDWEPSDENRV